MPTLDKEWLSAFLNAESRRLSHPDGRPLYAYRMQKGEFDTLAKTLTHCLKTFYGSVNWLKGTERLFVLYAAEWSRRKYSGGPWRWEDMTASIGWPSLSIKDRQTLTKEGMAFWKRELNRQESGSTSYLMSVATEGGFPVKLVERSETHLSRYLKAILDDYAMYSGAGMTAEKIAESHCNRLPSAFRRSAVYQLAADTVSAIYALSEGLEDTVSPFEALEREQPGWQSKLPLNFEEDNVKVLVDGLLKKAGEKRRSNVNQLKISRRFSRNADGYWEHRAKLELVSEVPLELLAEELDLTVEKLPRRLELAIYSEGVLTKVASMSREATGYFLYAYSPDKLLLNIAAESEVNCLVMEYGGERLGGLTIVGAEGLDDELPVSCYQDDEQLIYLGQGAVRSRLEQLYVLLPADCTIIEGEGYQQLDYRNRGFQDDGRWFQVNGDIQVGLNDDFSCRIRAGDRDDHLNSCVLRGKRQYLFELRNNPVFCGFPTLYRAVNGPSRQVPAYQIFWNYIGRRDQWHCLAQSQPVGDVRLRVVEDGNCIFSGRLSVLPITCQIRIEPSEDPLLGRLVIDRHGNAKAIADGIGNVLVNVREDDGTLSLECRSIQPFAGKIAVNLSWEGAGRSKLFLPFPGQGAHFVDIDGKQLHQRVISVNQLMSVSAVAVSHKQHVKFELHGLLRANDIDNSISRSSLKFSRSIISASRGYHELPLVELYVAMRDLFSYSADLDATVLLEIVSNGSSLARLEVNQFDSQLVYDSENLRVVHRCNDNLPLNKPMDIKLISMNGGEVPYINNQHLDDDNSFAWQLGAVDAQTTPCLALAANGMERNVRPCMVYTEVDPGFSDGEQTETSMLNLGVIFGAASKYERRRHFKSFMEFLLANPGADGWADLVAAVRRLSDAHPDSIDLYEVIIEYPEVVAGLLVRMTPSDLPILIDWQNYLPFRWWQLPVKQVVGALVGYLGHIKNTQSDYQELLVQSAFRQIENLVKFVPAFGVIADITLDKAIGRSPENCAGLFKIDSRSLYNYLNTNLKQNLYAQMGDRQWPRGLSREDWELHFNQKLPWLDDDGMGYRRPLLDSFVAQTFSVISGSYLNADQRAFVLSIKATFPSLFEQLFLTTSVCFYKAA